MPPKVSVYTAPPEALAKLLTGGRLLHALPLARRLQFTRFPGGITENTRILWSSVVALDDYPCDAAAAAAALPPFAAAYLDFSRGPETELWIYTSTEEGRVGRRGAGSGEMTGAPDEREQERARGVEEEIACAVALLREVKRQQDLFFAPGSARATEREFPTILVGNIDEDLRARLAGVGMAFDHTGVYDKWMFHLDALPDVAVPEAWDDGRRLVWDVVRPADIPLAVARSTVPRRERTVKLLPSTALYLDDGTPVAWAFLGPDSSLSSLHCEEPFRGRGIAKAVAVRLFRDHLKEFGDDGYGWADVAADNAQSRGVCRSLNGRVERQISWSRLHLDQSFPDE
ncbi:hypothetical protein F4802DRAFT_593386 [Xylaria palmicola]|nr:hypothetical protein F4802DRAFT_593386 [Xylaria palmicola]